MTTQKEIFKAGEGDHMFLRNKETSNSPSAEDDKIVNLIQSIELFPQRVLEIGCGAGRRLEIMRLVFQADCYGIDPSTKAIEDGKSGYPNISLQVGTA